MHPYILQLFHFYDVRYQLTFFEDVDMHRNNLKYNAFLSKFNVNFVPNVSLISEL